VHEVSPRDSSLSTSTSFSQTATTTERKGLREKASEEKNVTKPRTCTIRHRTSFEGRSVSTTVWGFGWWRELLVALQVCDKEQVSVVQTAAQGEQLCRRVSARPPQPFPFRPAAPSDHVS
jgi:hypothetical protein